MSKKSKNKILICGGGSQSMAVIDIIYENKDYYDLVGVVDIKRNKKYYLDIPFIGYDKNLNQLFLLILLDRQKIWQKEKINP